jgi:hypothetical protein
MHNPASMTPSRARLWAQRSALRCALLALASAFVGVGCGDTTDDRPAQWSFISATIVEPNCATVSCHSQVAQRAGVDLHTRDVGYHALVDRHFVFPGDSKDSSVMFLMHAQGSTRMPPDVPLPESDIALIARWIDSGATNQ